MKIKNLLSFSLLTFLFFTSCQKEQVAPQPDSSPDLPALSANCLPIVGIPPTASGIAGDTVRNYLMINGDQREYLVYLPVNYNLPNFKDYEFPIVFMHHGSGQVISRMVPVTRWNDLADTENFIVVYPQAWEYLMLNGSHQTKWVTAGSALDIDPSEVLRDDLTFINTIREAVIYHLRGDCERVYACGFSNGGGFIKTEIRIHLNEAFAATSSTGGIGLPFVTSPATGRHVPHFETVGDRDANALSRYYTPPLPASMPTNPAVWPTEPFWVSIDNMATSMGFNSALYATSLTPPFITYGSPALGLSYRFRMVPGLTHRYKTALTPDYWAFMSAFTL